MAANRVVVSQLLYKLNCLMILLLNFDVVGGLSNNGLSCDVKQIDKRKPRSQF